MVISYPITEERLTMRADALHSLGFCYDTALNLFFYEVVGQEPFIITKEFVTDTPNDIFFKEYCRFRDRLKQLKEEKMSSR